MIMTAPHKQACVLFKDLKYYKLQICTAESWIGANIKNTAALLNVITKRQKCENPVKLPKLKPLSFFF